MSSSALRDHYIQVENKQTYRYITYRWKINKQAVGIPQQLNRGENKVTEGTLTAVHLVQGDCLKQSFNSRKASLCRKNTKKDL